MVPAITVIPENANMGKQVLTQHVVLSRHDIDKRTAPPAISITRLLFFFASWWCRSRDTYYGASSVVH
jgi:hypothetical protein